MGHELNMGDMDTDVIIPAHASHNRHQGRAKEGTGSALHAWRIND